MALNLWLFLALLLLALCTRSESPSEGTEQEEFSPVKQPLGPLTHPNVDEEPSFVAVSECINLLPTLVNDTLSLAAYKRLDVLSEHAIKPSLASKISQRMLSGAERPPLDFIMIMTLTSSLGHRVHSAHRPSLANNIYNLALRLEAF